MIGTKLKDGYEIIEEEGILPFARESALFPLRHTPQGQRVLRKFSEKQVRDRIRHDTNLDQMLDTVLKIHPGIRPYHIIAGQLREELSQLAQTAAKPAPETVLEIGTSNGGTLYTWARYLSTAETIISLDLPNGRFGGGYSEEKTKLYDCFARRDTDMHYVRRNSHNPKTKDKITNLVVENDPDGTVDFLFIDGDHTYEGVKQDFEMYADLVSDGGIIAFHDIVEHPDQEEVVKQRSAEEPGIEERHLNWGEFSKTCNVHKLWAEIRDEYDTEEYVSHPKQTWGGIGVVKF